MGDWKAGLKKLKPKLKKREQRGSDSSVCPNGASESDQDASAWKTGVKPLKKCASKDTGRPPKSRKGSTKPKRIHTKDTIPSTSTLRGIYGHPPPTTNPTGESGQQTTLALPSFEELPKVILTQSSEFKEPDDWVSAGATLQPLGGGKGRVLRVRIGLDLGTAYTKVALRAADQVFFVDWDGLRISSQRYFLPGELSSRDSGSLWPGRPDDATETFCALKAPFLSDCKNLSGNVAASIAFLAWVMRYARAWLYRHQASLVGNRRLVWEVNIGCPIDPWCSTSSRENLSQVGICAWKLSQEQCYITLAAAKELLHTRPLSPALVGMDNLDIVPEFVAQIAGYLNSPQGKEDGLHLLADVGAGTLDIAAFNVFHPKKDDPSNVRLPIFTGTVEPLGTHVLMANRLKDTSLGKCGWNDLNGIPSVERIVVEFGIDGGELNRSDELFIKWLHHCVGRILDYTKKYREPGAEAWKEGMRIFLTGGGAACAIYKSGIIRAFSTMGTKPLFTTFPMLEAAAKCVGEHDFHRVSVAFGLTYDAESIGTMVQPKDIEDIEPAAHIREFPDRDELYPK